MNTKQPHQERALVIIKPDGVQRGLIGELIKRFEQTGLKIVGIKFLIPEKKQLERFYNKDDEWFLSKGTRIIDDLKEHDLPVEKEAIEYGKDIISMIIKYMQAAPVTALVLEGNQAVVVARKITGSTEPSTADMGTIRGDYTLDSYGHSTYEQRAIRNLIHCSDSPEEAEREIKEWFKDDELMDYVTAQERILYDVNFDGKKE